MDFIKYWFLNIDWEWTYICKCIISFKPIRIDKCRLDFSWNIDWRSFIFGNLRFMRAILSRGFWYCIRIAGLWWHKVEWSLCYAGSNSAKLYTRPITTHPWISIWCRIIRYSNHNTSWWGLEWGLLIYFGSYSRWKRFINSGRFNS